MSKIGSRRSAGRVYAIVLTGLAIGTMVFAASASAATFTTWSSPYSGQSEHLIPCSGNSWQGSSADASNGQENVGVYVDMNASAFCQVFGGDMADEGAGAGLHGGYWTVSGSSSQDYNLYFGYSITVTAYLASNCASGSSSEVVEFQSSIWDDSTGTNVIGPVTYNPSSLSQGHCVGRNICGTTFNSNFTVSLPGDSVFQPRVYTSATVSTQTNDWLATLSASAQVQSWQYNSGCGSDDGATLTSMFMYGYPGSAVSVTDPSNSTLG